MFTFFRLYICAIELNLNQIKNKNKNNLFINVYVEFYYFILEEIVIEIHNYIESFLIYYNAFLEKII